MGTLSFASSNVQGITIALYAAVLPMSRNFSSGIVAIINSTFRQAQIAIRPDLYNIGQVPS
jgi:hypothetical protein